MLFKDIKAIVFDLDGTLYEDTHHFEYYAQMISKQLDSSRKVEFMEEYYRAASGNHTLKIGRIYDSVEDLVLVHSQKNITEAYTWDGEPIDSSRVKELYPESIEIDMERYMSVGDPWWIPGSLGIHFGLTKDHTYEAFLQTREYMMSPEFVMSHVKDFTETLISLKDKVKLILLTNSPQPDSEVILKKLGMEDVFHKKIFNGKKPSLTLDRFNMVRGTIDKASHAYHGKKTDRVKIMYGQPGMAYVYLIYGMYYCMNVVTQDEGIPEAVLIRAIEPLEGLNIMSKRRFDLEYDLLPKKKKYNLTSGPGKLCIALDITKESNGADLTGDELYIEEIDIPKFEVVSSKRIGIDYAEEARDFLWRFYIKDNPFVSK